jgi:hypothetical protein
MHGSRDKIPRINLVRQRCAEGYNYGVKGLNTLLLDLSLWGWMKSEAYKRKVDTRGEFLTRILDAAARTKNREDQLRRTTRGLRTRIAKFTEDDGAIFESVF